MMPFTTSPQPATIPPTTFDPLRWLGRRLEIIPVLAILVALTIFFSLTTDGIFLSASNLTNLAHQLSGVGLLAIAAALCLLVGEINLSLSTCSAVAGAVMGIFSVYQGWEAGWCILGGLLTGMVIGLVQGLFVAALNVPSFIVTLAGTIGCSGLLLLVMGNQNSVSLRDGALRELAPAYQPLWLGSGLLAVCLLVGISLTLYARYKRRQLGLTLRPALAVALELGSVVVLTTGTLWVFYSHLGLPNSTLIWLASLLLFWLVLKYTDFGLHLYAVGDNPEAARRAGINTVLIKTSVFVLAGALAAGGGILLVSRATAVVSQFNLILFLYPIAIAAVGGISLFGGRGSLWTVILGALVIGGLDNGLDLLNQGTGTKLLAQGTVLLLAVTADVFIRRRRNKWQAPLVVRPDQQLDTILHDLNRAAGFIRRKEQADQQVSQQVLQLAALLKQAASQQATGSQDQRIAVQLVSTAVEQLSNSATNISELSEDVSLSIAKIATDSQQITVTTDFSVAQSKIGTLASNRTVEASQEVAQVYQQLVTTLNDLSAKNASTRRIMELLSSLASELHLLALNAAIEAAGSGIHGERFAVVAQEVKNMAARSRSASQEVVAIVQQIENASQQAVVSAQNGYQKALDMETIAAEARRIFDSMRQVAEQSQVQASSINTTTQQVHFMAEVIKIASVQQQAANSEVRTSLQALDLIAQHNVQGSQSVEATACNLETVSQNLQVV